MVYRAYVTLRGTAPMSQSRQHYSDKQEGESHDEYDRRTWREKCNYDAETGIMHIPAMALKFAVDAAAKRLEIPDPDNRRAKMTKNFVSGVLCDNNLPIGIHKDKVGSVTISANVDGRRGSGRRVPRTFPQVASWQGETSFIILDEKIKAEMFERALSMAGQAIGVGQFRPENGGINGRFEIVSVDYEKL